MTNWYQTQWYQTQWVSQGFTCIDATSIHGWFCDRQLKSSEDNNDMSGRFVRLLYDCQLNKPICQWFTHKNAKEPEFTSESDWVSHLISAFMLTGIGPSAMRVTTTNQKIYEKDISLIQKVYDFIYNMPIPPNIKFIEESRCFCNMGHCGALEDLKLIDPTPQCFGDCFKLFGDYKIPLSMEEKQILQKLTEKRNKYDTQNSKETWTRNDDELFYKLGGRRYALFPFFEYPDSVFLSIECLNTLPQYIGCTAYDKPAQLLNPTFQLDPKITYYTYGYRR